MESSLRLLLIGVACGGIGGVVYYRRWFFSFIFFFSPVFEIHDDHSRFQSYPLIYGSQLWFLFF